jgi:hypothetical protein
MSKYRVINEITGEALGDWMPLDEALALQDRLEGADPWPAPVIEDDDSRGTEELVAAIGY